MLCAFWAFCSIAMVGCATKSAVDAKTVADELGMSISKLNRIFRTMYATSLHSYVQDKRLEYAARLLQENDLPISQAAQLSGYTNMSHFSKSFVKKFGVLPKDY